MAKYELIFITRADIPEEEVDKLITQVDAAVAGTNGKTEKVEKMGRRRLAYRVHRQREGFYVLYTFEGTGDTVREFERRLKVSEPVIKYQTVRIDERLKRTAPAKPAAKPPAEPASNPELKPGGEEAAAQS